MEKPKRQAIVLRLDQSVVDAIDAMRDRMSMTRTQWLRKAVQRNLRRNLRELRLISDPKIQAVLKP